MSSKDIPDLLRFLTSGTGKNKLSMMQAMSRVKALQATNIRSIASIANADILTLSEVIGDKDAAKRLQSSAKSALKSRSGGVPSAEPTRKRSAYELDIEPETPQEIEDRLQLPQPSDNEEEIAKTTIHTNRAPLFLAVALALLNFTMPEQPLSSKLSLAQAVVSANSRSKAVSIGLTNGPSAEQDGWGHGQPKVRIMGREIHVLKRGGYDWKKPTETSQETMAVKDELIETSRQESPAVKTGSDTPSINARSSSEVQESREIKANGLQWAVSQRITLKGSTFVARSIGVSNPAQAKVNIQSLLSKHPELREATHNVTVWRIRTDAGAVIEDMDDDGETGGARHILDLLQSMDLTNVLVVMSRWYGGVLLYDDRWRLMSEVCRDSLSQRLRISGSLGQEALWGLDLEAMKSSNAPVSGGVAGGMQTHKPEAARAYIMKAFASGETSGKKKTGVALEREKEHNLGLLLGALYLLFGSWVEHISRSELDSRAYNWYVQFRPSVETGQAGWGAKGEVKLADILGLRRKG